MHIKILSSLISPLSSLLIPMFRFILCSLIFSGLTNFACDPAHKASISTKPADNVPQPIKNPANIAWMESDRLMPVLEAAQQKNLPVFVEFHAEWCTPCKIMEEELFTQETIFTYFNAYFLNFRTDYDSESGHALVDIFEVTSLPTILFLDPKGVVLERHSGSVTSGLLRSMGDSARAKMR